jgi:hypothetical protein
MVAKTKRAVVVPLQKRTEEADARPDGLLKQVDKVKRKKRGWVSWGGDTGGRGRR